MDPNDVNLSSDDDRFEHPKVTVQEHQPIQPESKAEKIILEAQEDQLRRSNRSILSEDIEMKLEETLEDIQEDEGKNFQSIITLRMQQLAYCKILVLTYQKSYFRLVQAHFHIGKQYLKFKCYEQAYHHLQTAIDKNTKATQSSVHKMYHSYLLSYLGQTLYWMERPDEALKILSRAVNIQEECEAQDNKGVNNIHTIKYLALSKVELGYEDASDSLAKAVNKTKDMLGERNRAYGLILYEQGRYVLGQGQNKEAIRLYEKAIEVIKMSTESECEEDIIKLYQELANLYEATDPEIYIETLKKKYQVFEDTYGNADKKSIKEQRNLVTALLKFKKIEESLDQCEDILEKEKRVYGDNSLEVGKQMKTIANIFIVKHDLKQADSYYKKALKIFHDLGDQRLARELKVKIASLQIQQRQ